MRNSLSALTLQTKVVMPAMAVNMTAVLTFQFFGCAYHPPAGDQTCFGYLSVGLAADARLMSMVIVAVRGDC